MATPRTRERMAALGGGALPMTPAEFGPKAAHDSRRFGAIIQEHRIAAE